MVTPPTEKPTVKPTSKPDGGYYKIYYIQQRFNDVQIQFCNTGDDSNVYETFNLYKSNESWKTLSTTLGHGASMNIYCKPLQCSGFFSGENYWSIQGGAGGVNYANVSIMCSSSKPSLTDYNSNCCISNTTINLNYPNNINGMAYYNGNWSLPLNKRINISGGTFSSPNPCYIWVVANTYK